MGETEFHKKLEEFKDQELSGETQSMLNKPLEKVMDPALEKYLQMVLDLLNSKKIDVYLPASLVKKEIYKGLSEMEQGQVDLACMNLCGILRQLQDLWNREHTHSYQTELLIQTIFQTKDRLEQKVGDVLFL